MPTLPLWTENLLWIVNYHLDQTQMDANLVRGYLPSFLEYYLSLRVPMVKYLSGNQFHGNH